jgi:hypothetical protein
MLTVSVWQRTDAGEVSAAEYRAAQRCLLGAGAPARAFVSPSDRTDAARPPIKRMKPTGTPAS